MEQLRHRVTKDAMNAMFGEALVGRELSLKGVGLFMHFQSRAPGGPSYDAIDAKSEPAIEADPESPGILCQATLYVSTC